MLENWSLVVPLAPVTETVRLKWPVTPSVGAATVAVRLLPAMPGYLAFTVRITAVLMAEYESAVVYVPVPKSAVRPVPVRTVAVDATRPVIGVPPFTVSENTAVVPEPPAVTVSRMLATETLGVPDRETDGPVPLTWVTEPIVLDPLSRFTNAVA
jgi:hypothetical protein